MGILSNIALKLFLLFVALFLLFAVVVLFCGMCSIGVELAIDARILCGVLFVPALCFFLISIDALINV